MSNELEHYVVQEVHVNMMYIVECCINSYPFEYQSSRQPKYRVKSFNLLHKNKIWWICATRKASSSMPREQQIQCTRAKHQTMGGMGREQKVPVMHQKNDIDKCQALLKFSPEYCVCTQKPKRNLSFIPSALASCVLFLMKHTEAINRKCAKESLACIYLPV